MRAAKIIKIGKFKYRVYVNYLHGSTNDEIFNVYINRVTIRQYTTTIYGDSHVYTYGYPIDKEDQQAMEGLGRSCGAWLINGGFAGMPLSKYLKCLYES